MEEALLHNHNRRSEDQHGLVMGTETVNILKHFATK